MADETTGTEAPTETETATEHREAPAEETSAGETSQENRIKNLETAVAAMALTISEQQGEIQTIKDMMKGDAENESDGDNGNADGEQPTGHETETHTETVHETEPKSNHRWFKPING